MTTKARDFAIEAHASVNHTYDGKPYAVHLEIVAASGEKHLHLIPAENRADVLAACWLHDTIEDCRLTYNDVKAEFGETIAELVYALTNEKGRTRKDRANAVYYEGIRNTPNAVFVKLCDRLANIRYSAGSNSRMLAVYQKEHDDFIAALLPQQSQRYGFREMIAEMESYFANETAN